MGYLFLRTADDTSLAIADDLLCCDWLGRLGANDNSGSPPSCDCDFGSDRWRRLASCLIGKQGIQIFVYGADRVDKLSEDR